MWDGLTDSDLGTSFITLGEKLVAPAETQEGALSVQTPFCFFRPSWLSLILKWLQHLMFGVIRILNLYEFYLTTFLNVSWEF